MVWDLKGGGAFLNADHLRSLNKEKHNGKKYWDTAYKSKLNGLVSNIKVLTSVYSYAPKSQVPG